MKDHSEWNKLGCAYFAEQKWLEAADAFQRAIESRADFIDAYYNLGLAQNKQGLVDQALITWRALLELAPTHSGARFQVGSLLMRQSKFNAALDQFAVIQKNQTAYEEALANMAACCLQLGWLNEAKKYYHQVLLLIPSDVQTLYNLGVLSAQQGALDEAINYYLRAINMDPDFFAAHNNLGAAYLVLKNREAAAKHFKEALRIQPSNEALGHTLAILAHKQDVAVSPQSYISALFDSYADHYDAHLAHSLQYKVPTQIFDMMHHVLKIPEYQWKVLDLGCGTGLCGQFFRASASSLAGVDLSERMLDVAREKKIYDELVKADALEFLQQQHAKYDLIIAGDTLVYIGDLAPLFSAAHQALKPSGYFIFNVEATDEKDWQLTPTGRFAHNKTYLDDLIASNHFHILSFRALTIRTQDSFPVHGYLYLIQI